MVNNNTTLCSVVGLIDSYCICDTGSTDNTSGIISSFFQSQVPPIPGRIIFEPFKDFGYNRSFALAACENANNADYMLLMDADMILELSAGLDPVAFKNGLTENAYHFFQGSRAFHYKNVRIVKNNIGASYWGVTHEYVKLPEGSRTTTLPISTIFINDVGDGGSKGDKFERDVRLLKQGLVDVPNNERYTFYLANTLFSRLGPQRRIQTLAFNWVCNQYCFREHIFKIKDQHSVESNSGSQCGILPAKS